jgi:hypothetical protein
MTPENPFERDAAPQFDEDDQRPAGIGSAVLQLWRESIANDQADALPPERFHLGWWPTTDWFAAEIALAAGLHLNTTRLPEPWANWVDVRWEQIRRDIAEDYLVVDDPAGGVHVFERPGQPDGPAERLR